MRAWVRPAVDGILASPPRIPGRGAMPYLLRLLLLYLFIASAVVAAAEPMPSLEQLEAEGAIIGSIEIRNNDVFDTSLPEEDKWLYRLANRWHINTRPGVIRGQLLFASGDALQVRRLQESERVLRRNRYLYSATVRPLRYENGIVDLVVETKDVWTLGPTFSISREGGENETQIEVEDLNLLGTGSRLSVVYSDDVDRESLATEYSNANIGNTWWGLAAIAEDNDDGHRYSLGISRPFFSLDTRWSAGFGAVDAKSIERIFDLGDPIAAYRTESRAARVFGGWSKGLRNGWARRWTAGLAFEDTTFSDPGLATLPAFLPRDRELVYPFLGFELVQDDFVEVVNGDQIGRVEDVFLGSRFAAEVGFAAPGLGSDRSAVLLSAAASKGFGSVADEWWLLKADARGRYEDSRLDDALFNLDVRYYRRQSERRLFFIEAKASVGDNLDFDRPLELGGDTGLRAYPLRYQRGDKLALVSVEQRYFTDWYPFRLVRIGGAVFADVGRTWGDNPLNRASEGWLTGVGFGLRLASTRASIGKVFHIDVAFPLNGDGSIDDVQFILESRRSF